MNLRLSLCLFLAALALGAQGLGGRGGGVVPIQPNGSPSPKPPAPPPPGDCAASGTVINSITGAPITRATVTLSGGDGAGSSTDEQGRWSLSNTTCSTRIVNATRVGFVNSMQSPAGARPVRVDLVSGSPATNVKITLTPEAVIAGRVQDVNGDPVESVQIMIMRVMIQGGKRLLNNAAGGTADSQGNFRIGGLTPGRYIVCADSRQVTYPVGGGPGMVYRNDCYPGPPAAGVAVAMPIEAGREVRTALTLTPVRGAHVRGSISGAPDWAPGQPRLQIQLMQSQNGRGGPNTDGQVASDATFDFAAVQPGSYLVRAFLPPAQNGPAWAVAQTTVEVGDSDVNGVGLALQPAGSLIGSVRFVSSNPAGIGTSSAVVVRLGPAAPGIGVPGPTPQAQWDADDVNFVFATVPAGQFGVTVNVNGQNSSGIYIKSATLHGQDVLSHPVTVEGSTGPIDIVISNDSGGIDATVNDANGQPVASAVILVPATGPAIFLNSGDDGHATRSNIATGDYRAWAFDDIGKVPYAEDDWMSQNAGPGERVTITTAGTATVTLKRIAAPAE